jgi:hypothetical protein
MVADTIVNSVNIVTAATGTSLATRATVARMMYNKLLEVTEFTMLTLIYTFE